MGEVIGHDFDGAERGCGVPSDVGDGGVSSLFVFPSGKVESNVTVGDDDVPPG